MLQVVYHDGLFDDLQGIDTEGRSAVFGVVEQIAINPSAFKNRLIVHREVGDLSSCFKAYIDPDPNRYPELPARYRLVFQLVPDSKLPEAVFVIAFGQRDGLEAYRRAMQRLTDRPGPIAES